MFASSRPTRLLGAVGAFALLSGICTAGPAAAVAVPAVDSIRLLPASVDTSDGASSVGVVIHGTGDPTTLDVIEASATCAACPAGTAAITLTVDDIVTDDPGDWTRTESLGIPQSTRAGSWLIDSVTVHAGAASTAYDDADLTAVGIMAGERTFTVAHSADTTAPAVTGVVVSPSTLDVTVADGLVTFAVGVHDSDPGVESGTVHVLRDGDLDPVDVSLDVDNLTSGSPHLGTYTVFLPVTSYQAGSYAVTSVDLTDGYGNSTTVTNPGTWDDFTVVTDLDETAPDISSVGVSPAGVNATDGPAKTMVTTAITDATSGFASGDITFSNGTDTLTVLVDASDRTTGTSNDGVYVSTLTVPERTPAGVYTADAVSVTDRAGNLAVVPTAPVTITVTTAADTTGATLASLQVASSTVNVGESGARAAVYLSITDDASGVQTGTLYWTSPTGEPLESYFERADRVSGTGGAGTYRLVLPAEETGTYTLNGLDVTDLDGHPSTFLAAALNAANGGVVPSFVAVNEPDETAPTATSVDVITPNVTSRTDGYASARVRVHARDLAPAGSHPTGIDSIYLTFRSPSGTQVSFVNSFDCEGSYSSDFSCLESGNLEEGDFLVDVVLPSYAQSGSWTLADVTVYDRNFNSQNIHDVSTVTGSKTITVSGPSDGAAPQLAGLVLPGSVDATNGEPTRFDVSAHVTDDVSGLAYGSLYVESPSGLQYATVELSVLDPFWYDGQQHPLDITLPGSGALPKKAESGDWQVSAFFIDVAGNEVDLSPADLAAMSLPSTITVDGSPDTAAPDLVAMTVSRTSVDTTTGSRSVLVDLHATDAGTGLDSASMDLTLAGSIVQTVNFDRIGGDANDGWFEGVIRVGQYDPPGTWTFSNLELGDAVGNRRTLGAGDLAGASLPNSLAVSSLGDVHAGDGVIDGVVTSAGTPVSGAYVSVCNTVSNRCRNAISAAGGGYSIGSLGDGSYDIDVSAPSGSDFESTGATVTGLYALPNHHANRHFNLTAPIPLPPGNGTSVNGDTSGIPTVFYGDPVQLSTTGCPGGTATYTVSLGGTVIKSGSLAEAPPGTYTATITRFAPDHGTGQVHISVQGCVLPADNHGVDFSIYIDPSGFVLDTDHAPVAGAQVALFRSDVAAGPFSQVPNGSPIMSPSNRQNPDASDATGHYGWDTVPGFYRVRVTKSHCYAPGSFNAATGTVQSFVDSAIVQIPPEVTDLDPVIDCRNIAPVGSASRDGAASINAGARLNFTATASDPNGAIASYVWAFGDGGTATGSTAAHVFSATGTFAPKVTVTDDQGGSRVFTVSQVRVVTPPSTPPSPPSTVRPPTSRANPPVDTTAPTAGLTGPGATTLASRFTVAWTGVDASGVSSYDVRYRSAAWNRNLGGYSYPNAWQATRAVSSSMSGAFGATYCFSVRARDAAGNLSPWSTERCTALPLDDRSLAAKGAWKRGKGNAYVNRTVSTSTARRATLTRAGVLAGRVALVATTCKGCGKVGVYYNGKLAKTVKLAATRTHNRAVIGLPRFTKGTGTVVIKVLKPGKGVRIDGLVTARK